MWQVPMVQLLTASVIAGILGVSGFFLTATVFNPDVTIHLEPAHGTVLIGEEFKVSIIIDSHIPTNVFKGVLQFDPEKLSVTSIDYNTSIADLWAEAPWYSNGDGTISFIGGTTKPGGYVGSGTLITVTFASKTLGEATMQMNEVQVLKHDGLGTEVPLTEPIDAIFAVSEESLQSQTVQTSVTEESDIQIVRTIPNTDLNGDGKQSMTDISIFMSDYMSQNLRSDFSGDGKVDIKDLSFITAA